MHFKKLLATTGSMVLALAGIVTLAPAAQAAAIRNYQVAFTNGIGVRLRTAPNMNAPGFATGYGDLGIAEGSWFPAECEEYGDWVTNVYGESTNIYLRGQGAAFGVQSPVHVSTAWLNTGTNSSTGLPQCGGPAGDASASGAKPTGEITTDAWGVPAPQNKSYEASGGLRPAMLNATRNVQGHCNNQRNVGWDIAYAMCNHYLDKSGSVWKLPMSKVIDKERPLWSMYEWQMRNAVSNQMSSMKSVDAATSRTFTWSTGWMPYTALNPLSDVYQALRGFSIAQKGDIWVGPADAFGDRAVQIRYRSFATDVYDFGPEYVSEYTLAEHGWANPFEVHGQTNLIVFNTTLNQLQPWSIPFQF